MTMRVLVIGAGAREHAVVARLAADRDVGELVCTPGNPGIARLARTIPSDISNPDALLELAEREQIDFTVVGPELPLSVGIADRFTAAGRLLLCSDGLSDLVSVETMEGLLNGPGGSVRAVKSLWAAAMNASGRDNITIALVEPCGPAHHAAEEAGR